MCGGGSTQQTTQQVTIPPNVLARYDAVNAKASKAADAPFQEYGGRFVAPTTAQQQRGFAGTDTYANYAQPAYQEGMGLTRQAQGQGQSYINGSTGQLMQAQNQAQPIDWRDFWPVDAMLESNQCSLSKVGWPEHSCNLQAPENGR